MALNLTSFPTSPTVQTHQPTDTGNDAFSFWKLPGNWRCELEPVIAGSEAIVTIISWKITSAASTVGRRR